jgi:hypothetical protein
MSDETPTVRPDWIVVAKAGGPPRLSGFFDEAAARREYASKAATGRAWLYRMDPVLVECTDTKGKGERHGAG